MKLFRYTLVAAALLATSSIASAVTTRIYIVGSNGDRTGTQTAIGHILTSWTYQGVKGTVTSAAGSLSIPQGDNFGAWNGLYNGNPVIIKVSFLGAWAGLQYAADSSQTAPFVATDAPVGSSGTVPDPSLAATPNGSKEFHSATFGFSTNFQATSPYSGTYQGHTYVSPLNDQIVGISPLIFYASPGFPGSPSSDRPSFRPNITVQLLQQLYGSGEIRLSQITGDYTRTGNQNDAHIYIYPLGRNTDAGQRYGVLTEFGLGVNGIVRHVAPRGSSTGVSSPALPTTPTGQSSYTISGQSVSAGGTVGYQTLWPTETVSGTNSGSDGNSGFTTGSSLAPYLTVALGPSAYKFNYFDAFASAFVDLHSDAVNGYYIGYLTPGDGSIRVVDTTTLPTAAQGVDLSFNGVRYSPATVQNGTYTAWVYNHLVDRGDLGTGNVTQQFRDGLATQISTADATALGVGILNDSNVKVQRAGEGAAVVPQ